MVAGAIRNPKLGSVGREIAVAGAAVGMVFMLVVPLPHWLLDLLLALDLTVALGVLMVTFYVSRPLEFSSFPSLLLLVTLFRLALNVSATRLILGTGEAGAVIHAFGNYVVGGNFVVGIVVFIVLVVIQFVVITSGAGRVAEVAARFTLDAMPGKQMAIDAELNSGAIDEVTARSRRQDVAREADFYGSMDGASKFIRGDAIAAVLMILVNILGGFAIGMFQRGMDFAQAARTYTILTVGEGLVTQVPALLISAAAGLIVTRNAGEANLSRELGSQMVAHPKALFVAAGVLGLLSLTPRLPHIPFLALAGSVGWYAFQLQKQRLSPPPAPPPANVSPVQEDLTELLTIDPLEVELGYALVSLADPKQGGDLLERITGVRRQIATELGFVVPPIRVRDNVRLRGNQYTIRLRGMEIGEGSLFPQSLLAIDSGTVSQVLSGIPSQDPAFGLPAVWVAHGQRTLAEVSGYTVADPTHVLVTHLSELVRRHSPEILTRTDTQLLLDAAKKHAPAVVDELIPNLLPLGQVQKVLQALLRERVTIRDLVAILEALADAAPTTQEVEPLTEYVRGRLARTLTRQYTESDGRLYCFTLHPTVEQTISEGLRRTEAGPQLVLDPPVMQSLTEGVRGQVERIIAAGHHPLLLCAPRVRPAARLLAERVMPTITVLSYGEISPGVAVESTGMVS